MLRSHRPGRTRVRHVRGPSDPLDLLRRVEVGREAGVHAKDLFVDDGSKGQDIENILEALPHLDVIPSFALVVEAIDAIDGCALVVAAKQEEIFRVLYLVS